MQPLHPKAAPGSRAGEMDSGQAILCRCRTWLQPEGPLIGHYSNRCAANRVTQTVSSPFNATGWPAVNDTRLWTVSVFLGRLHFANRLYPGALTRSRTFASGTWTLIVSDEAVDFQPRQVRRPDCGKGARGPGC